MQLTIKNKTENALLHRQELNGEINFEGATPTNKEVVEDIAKQSSVNIELIVMKQIKTRFGHCQADFLAFVYDSKEARDKIEVTTKHMKKQLEEAKKKAEETKKVEAKPVEDVAPVETKKEEAPTEEKAKEPQKEEKPVEEKKEEVAEETPKEKKVEEQKEGDQ